MIFETERLRARHLTGDDAEACFAIYGDPEVTRFVTGDGSTIPSVEIVRDQIAGGMLAPGDDPRFGMWGLERRADAHLVGVVALIEVEDLPGEYETGWHLARDAWGNGYAFESGIALLRHGFDVAGLERVHALTRVGNERSIRACARLGMQRRADRAYQGVPHAAFVAERGTWSAPAT